jgi:hypothetical protein
MNYLAAKYVQPIHECFSQWGEIIQHSNEPQWIIASNRTSNLSLRANLIENWIQISADTGAVAGHSLIWSVLHWNGELDGAAKFSLGPASRSIGVQAEIPLDNEASIIPDLSATLAGFEQATSLVHNPSGLESDLKTNTNAQSVCEGAERVSAQSLQQILAEAGWPFTERSGGSYMVELDSKDDFHQALIKAEPDRSRRASVELAVWEAPAPVSKAALAVLLLTAAGTIRMVRPVVEDFGDRIAARFDIRFSPDASPALVDRGLSSLSVVSRFCGREVIVLNNMRIADQYLAVRHFTIE